ncbi:hypothetical protein VTN77DRAFT_6358 [Rasamsonia byssochlamydoides]|uniref:uncharacterized protein n=1 Tax=Rasamsonia byssochlamydoides TaxID=89139 RepID=UPI003743CFE8
MNNQGRQPTSNRTKKACTECRQQKAKCDAYLNPDQPCSRCRKVQAKCVISDPFKREHKRKRLSELEHEAEELRRKLRNSESSNSLASPIAVLTAAAEMGVAPGNLAAIPPATSPPHSSGYLNPTAPPVPVDLRPPAVLQNGEGPGMRSGAKTLARTLNGVRVEGEEIDDIFQLFFRDYAPFMPILDPHLSPNAYYAQSSLLFWVIIGVACRSYSRNPTLPGALSRNVLDTVLLSMASNSAALYKIQALLLLLTWPFPKLDVLFPLSGFLLNLAMQNGLHIPMSTHEFAKMKRNHLSEIDVHRRSELWAQCIIVYQRACLCKGQAGRALLDLVPESGRTLCERLCPSVSLQLKCLDIATRCSCAVLENGVRNMSAEQERALNIILRTFEHQLDDLEAQLPSNADLFYTTLCRLHIRVLHFYKSLSGTHDGCFSRLLATACTVIDYVATLGEKPEFYLASPLFVTMALALSCCSLLRLLKSAISRDLDTERARSSLFRGINMMKCMSVDSDDAAAMCANLLKQLWNSSKAFRKPDGTEHSTLRIRSRLVMSPLIDALWWWREECDPQHKLLMPEGETVNDLNRDPNGGIPTQDQSVVPPERPEVLQFLNDDFLTDFEWALGNDYLLPPTEPYGTMTWSSATNGV